MKQSLRDTLYNPKRGYKGQEQLFRETKGGVSRKDLKEHLSKDPLHQIFQPINKIQNSYIADYPLEEFQIDIIYMPNTHRKNDDYVLTCIDVGTKIADARILNDKTSKEAIRAMTDIIQDMEKPKQIYCDSGGEFTSTDFKNWAKDNNINMFYTLQHANFIERFNQTIKDRIYKYITHYGYETWNKDLLKDMIENYNNSYHRIIGMTPNEAKENWEKAKENIMLHALPVKDKYNIQVGDKVRTINKQGTYKHSYLPNWSKQIYQVERIENGTGGAEYYLHGKEGEYLENDLLHIPNDTYEIYTPVERFQQLPVDITRHIQEYLQPVNQKVKHIKEKKAKQYLKKHEIDEANIIDKPRERKATQFLRY